ncbi:hypothetical protein RKD37_001218 [Streptomyces ambofaciens]|uniref:hypothetical protein n=1 Tax=Streptomyces TaxID=1883 RepID=UPI000D59BE7D|nr:MULTISPECIES: hypothetical protein [Streptomyces]MBU6531772.1 hypothetical protein [Streptomyces sp. A108]
MQPQLWKPVGLQYRRPEWQDAFNTVITGTVIFLLPQVPSEMTLLACVPLLRCIRYRNAV